MPESFLLVVAGLASVFGWAFFSFWSAIPAGIALSLSPVWVCATAIVSYASGVLVVVLVGEPIRRRIQARTQSRQAGTPDDEKVVPNRMVVLITQAWHRFGLVGLALLAPMTVGAQVGAVIGLGLGVQAWRLLLAMTLGAAVWAVVLTLAAVGAARMVSAGG